MEENKCIKVILPNFVAGTVFSLIIVFFKLAGFIDLPWEILLSGFACVFVALFFFTVFAITVIWIFGKLSYSIRRRKRDRQIIEQATFLGIWDEPKALGGRALELYAKEKRGIKREPGETDASLRRRCMEVEK